MLALLGGHHESRVQHGHAARHHANLKPVLALVMGREGAVGVVVVAGVSAKKDVKGRKEKGRKKTSRAAHSANKPINHTNTHTDTDTQTHRHTNVTDLEAFDKLLERLVCVDVEAIPKRKLLALVLTMSQASGRRRMMRGRRCTRTKNKRTTTATGDA